MRARKGIGGGGVSGKWSRVSSVVAEDFLRRETLKKDRKETMEGARRTSGRRILQSELSMHQSLGA